MPSKRNPLLERRHELPEESVWWSSLSLAQKFAANTLSKYGYEIDFVRNESGRSTAVLSSAQGQAIIFEDGEIDMSSHIKIR